MYSLRSACRFMAMSMGQGEERTKDLHLQERQSSLGWRPWGSTSLQSAA